MQDLSTKDELSDIPLCISSSRMRNMMKSSPEVDCVSSDAVIAMIKATELFVKEMVLLSKPRESNEINYKDLSSIQNVHDRFSFLSDILPQKITAKEWKEKYEKLFESS
ncbi:unnamed protein product [Rodentolepis nana]|uniref:CBFD_NFYB_HMF domain-containing protein n=1 Tax=Rodentolepis nana TaxID=102285 RepID=A0A0R3TAQ0_RODNA|nr:unnamed protein product [Rodentolepis nana]